jgi:hypothetical protein
MLAVACSGGPGGKPASAVKSASTAQGATTTTAAGSPTTIDKTVWFAGFQVTIKNAAISTAPDTAVTTVNLAVTLTNEGPTPVRFDGLIDLGSGGSHYKFDNSTLPNVAGGASHDDNLSFDVDTGFKLDGATLTIGQPGHHQAVIPLGGAGNLIDLAPITLGLSGSVMAGNLKVSVKGGEVRTDVPADHVELDQNTAALALTLDIHYGGDNSYPFGHNNLALVAPNGSQIAVSAGPIEVLTPNATRTNETVRFLIPEPVNGAYQLILRDPTANGVQAAWPWTLAVNQTG